MIWDYRHQDIVLEALTGVHGLPNRGDVVIDQACLRAQLRDGVAELRVDEEPVIYGGMLIRHFGHFIHESLSRLWWLGPLAAMPPHLREAAEQLQSLEARVCFFMPPWLDRGKDLLPYMEEIMASLGLAAERVLILAAPRRFERMLIPFQAWGFQLDQNSLDQRYGCDSRALMRRMLAANQFLSDAGPAPSLSMGHPRGIEGEPRRRRVFVSRSQLPLDLGRLIGDVLLDPVLSEGGFEVFYPEQHSLGEQISRYSAADEIVFIDGSSLYLLWFSRLKPGARIRVILRRRQGRWLTERLLELLPQASSLRWELIDALMGEALTAKEDWLSHNLIDLGKVLHVLLGQAPASLSPVTQQALATYAHQLTANLSPGQQAAILTALLAAKIGRAHV